MSYLPPPLMEYPHPISTQPTSGHGGSFGPVFIVLAVIAILATTACVVGRLCARRLCRPKSQLGRTHATGDIEGGFEVNIPTGKPAGKHGAKGEANPAGSGRGLKGDPIATRHANIIKTRWDADPSPNERKAKFMGEATRHANNTKTKWDADPSANERKAKFMEGI